MRIAMTCLLMLWSIFCGGCAFPRDAYMCARVHSEVPMIPDAPLQYMIVRGSITPELMGGPSVNLMLRSPLAGQETLEWYKGKLFSQGWKPEHDSTWEYTTPTRENSYPNRFYAARDSVWQVGSMRICYAHERLTLALFPQDSGCDTEVIFDGFYVWDLPTRWGNSLVIYPAACLMGEGVVLLLPVLEFF